MESGMTLPAHDASMKSRRYASHRARSSRSEMMALWLPKIDAEELADEFATAVMAQTDVMLVDPKLGNRWANRYIKVARMLRASGETGRNELAKLIRHPRPDVKVAAAAFLLDWKTEEALDILERISKGEGLISFEASEAIKRWKEGNWHLDK